MNITQLLTNPILLGPIVALLVQALKALPVPFTGQTRAGLLAALTILAIGVQIAAAILGGNVQTLDLAGLLPQLLDAASTLLAAAGVYSLGKRLSES